MYQALGSMTWAEDAAAKAGPDGAPIVSALPASSLYHMTLAAAEMDRLRRAGSA